MIQALAEKIPLLAYLYDLLIAPWSPALAFTGHLAGGFTINLLISVVSMTLGTVIGVILGRMRFAGVRVLDGPSRLATNICRNVPSFVLLFYMASMIPSEVNIAGQIMAVPLWIKAALALLFPVIGFCSDQSCGYFEQRKTDPAGARETFVIAWTQYFLIIIMASATASVIGADEIVGRANSIISQTNDDQLMLSIYFYVSLWFLASGLLVTGLIKTILKLGPKVEN
ncbi:hypothetical protein [uncultured Roseobacter sp.]|uniref:hypothetical protein n=1 Tax=uncultured Roseobacter sp. TaxID=114847 RepID=UPI00260ADA4C|nr:hypothetical protein [uncultured Roseobacter sp.]